MIIYFNNCKNRDHLGLFGPGAFYDLDSIGHHATLVVGLPKGTECVVASAPPRSDTVVFDYYKFSEERLEMDKKQGREVRVFFGVHQKSDPLSKSDAARSELYKHFFNIDGNFKQLSVVPHPAAL